MPHQPEVTRWRSLMRCRSPAMSRPAHARVFAISSAQRAAEYPDVPTMAEAGVPDLEVTLWSGLFAPVATPSAIVNRLERELMEIVRQPGVRERLQAMAVQPNGEPARDLAQRVAAEMPRWTAVAQSANVKLD
jgi:tripartite-type tricarboxylate transporter receptor subunit TctC